MSFISSLSSDFFLDMSMMFVAFITDTMNLLFGFNILGFSDVLPVLRFSHFLLIFTSIYATIRLKGNNIIGLPKAFKLTFASKDGEFGISSLKALFTTVGGSAGLGGIGGSAACIYLGGPGAVFWMFITILLVGSLRASEVWLSLKYRLASKDISKIECGPSRAMKGYYASIGYPKVGLFLGYVYAILFGISTLGGASAFQSSQAVSIIVSEFDFLENSRLIVALVMGIIVFLAGFGGLKSVSGILSKTTPITISFYFIGCFTVIVRYAHNIPGALYDIVYGAFILDPKLIVTGGIFGVMILSFVRVAVSSEAGVGTAAFVYGASSRSSVAEESVASMSSTVVGTSVVCLMTALTCVVSGSYTMPGAADGVTMISTAFRSISPVFSRTLALLIPLLALNIMIAWSYYGSISAHYLFGTSKARKPYVALFSVVVVCGGLISDFSVILGLVDIVNTANGIPNLITMLTAMRVISSDINGYLKKSK